jgi:hypothetical protein
LFAGKADKWGAGDSRYTQPGMYVSW